MPGCGKWGGRRFHLAGRSGYRRPFERGFHLCQPLFEGPDLMLLRPDLLLLYRNRGVLLLQFVQQHGSQYLVLYRLDLPVG